MHLVTEYIVRLIHLSRYYVPALGQQWDMCDSGEPDGKDSYSCGAGTVLAHTHYSFCVMLTLQLGQNSDFPRLLAEQQTHVSAG